MHALLPLRLPAHADVARDQTHARDAFELDHACAHFSGPCAAVGRAHRDLAGRASTARERAPRRLVRQRGEHVLHAQALHASGFVAQHAQQRRVHLEDAPVTLLREDDAFIEILDDGAVALLRCLARAPHARQHGEQDQNHGAEADDYGDHDTGDRALAELQRVPRHFRREQRKRVSVHIAEERVAAERARIVELEKRLLRARAAREPACDIRRQRRARGPSVRVERDDARGLLARLLETLDHFAPEVAGEAESADDRAAAIRVPDRHERDGENAARRAHELHGCGVGWIRGGGQALH